MQMLQQQVALVALHLEEQVLAVDIMVLVVLSLSANMPI